MKRNYLIIFVLIIIVCALLKYVGFFDQLSLRSMQERADVLVEHIENHYLISVVLFILFYAAVIMIALPGFAPLTMLSGYMFGTIPGAVYALVGALLGSIISYLYNRLVRRNKTTTKGMLQLCKK